MLAWHDLEASTVTVTSLLINELAPGQYAYVASTALVYDARRRLFIDPNHVCTTNRSPQKVRIKRFKDGFRAKLTPSNADAIESRVDVPAHFVAVTVVRTVRTSFNLGHR